MLQSSCRPAASDQPSRTPPQTKAIVPIDNAVQAKTLSVEPWPAAASAARGFRCGLRNGRSCGAPGSACRRPTGTAWSRRPPRSPAGRPRPIEAADRRAAGPRPGPSRRTSAASASRSHRRPGHRPAWQPPGGFPRRNGRGELPRLQARNTRHVLSATLTPHGVPRIGRDAGKLYRFRGF